MDELKDLENPWNQILNSFADEVLAEGGVVREDYSIRVHPMAFQKIPEKVLEKTPGLVNADQFRLEEDAGKINIRYLKDDFGALIFLVLISPDALRIGTYLAPKFYQLLQKLESGLSKEELLIELAMPDRFLRDATSADKLREKALLWYRGVDANKSDAIEILRQLGAEESWGDLTDADLRGLIKEWLLEKFEEKKDDVVWLSKFVSFVTGLSFVRSVH